MTKINIHGRGKINKHIKLTQSRLKEVLDYDPATGIFTYKTKRANLRVGDIPKCKNEKGYIKITIDYKPYYAHRLAWFYVYGYLPENRIDHINRVPDANWIANLREVAPTCNARNTGNRANTSSGVKGVYWRQRDKIWMSRITVKAIKKYLGSYRDFADAVCARLAAEQCLNWSGCDSSSPAFKYISKMLGENNFTACGKK